MEATIQSTNRAINIDINVSINVDALKAIIQRGLQTITQSAWQAIKQRVLMTVKQATNVCCNVGAAAWDAVREKVRTIDVGNVLSNLWIGGWSIACFYLIYMYA